MKALIRFGKYTDVQKEHVVNFINRLVIDEKHEYEFECKPYKQNKTLEQLGYFYAVIVPVAMDWQGLTKNQAEAFLKEECLPPVCFSTLDRKEYQYRPSIGKGTKIDVMSKFIDDCVNFLGSHGQYVPPPTYKWSK